MKLFKNNIPDDLSESARNLKYATGALAVTGGLVATGAGLNLVEKAKRMTNVQKVGSGTDSASYSYMHNAAEFGIKDNILKAVQYAKKRAVDDIATTSKFINANKGKVQQAASQAGAAINNAASATVSSGKKARKTFDKVANSPTTKRTARRARVVASRAGKATPGIIENTKDAVIKAADVTGTILKRGKNDVDALVKSSLPNKATSSASSPNSAANAGVGLGVGIGAGALATAGGAVLLNRRSKPKQEYTYME